MLPTRYSTVVTLLAEAIVAAGLGPETLHAEMHRIPVLRNGRVGGAGGERALLLSRRDLSEIFLELGLELTETELGHILEQLDTDGSWRVDVHSLRLCLEAAVGAAATAPL